MISQRMCFNGAGRDLQGSCQDIFVSLTASMYADLIVGHVRNVR